MYFTPATFLAKLLAAMQVLLTLDMPLSTTMALPVTSKPIESTVENLAWQAWIELPPEQKQQVKSRKVTPKSIFTLPLRVQCPEGHKQVDTKCIPIAIGNNDVLIDLSALGLLVGTTQVEDLYDYDEMGEETAEPFSFGNEMSVGDAENPNQGLTVELKPPSKDEPLKFNIFENKFHILHEEPSEDYSSFLNEGLQSSEREKNVTASLPSHPTNESAVAAGNVTAINDSISESSNRSESNFHFYVQQEKNVSLADSEPKESNTFTTAIVHNVDLKIDAISVPAVGFNALKHNNLSVAQNESDNHSDDTESTTVAEDRDKLPENDIQTLLQTESFLPLLNHTTATTLQNSILNKSLSLTTVALREPSESSADVLGLNVEEDITTLPTVIEADDELRYKQEYTRSVTLNPIITNDSNILDGNTNGDNDQVNDSTLETVTNIEPLETTTPIQLDETTIIETDSSLSATSSTQQELNELLLQQEQAQKDFEELQRMRKGQKYKHVVIKKSKVQPVEVLSTTAQAAAKTYTTAATISANVPTASKRADELITSTEETVTPLLTVHNENDSNNDRFYYQHFENEAAPDNEVTQRSGSEFKQKTATALTTTKTTTVTAPVSVSDESTKIAKIPLTSEIDLAEELRLINDLVKGIRPATTLTTIATTTTTDIPKAFTIKTLSGDDIPLNTSFNNLSESSAVSQKPTSSTTEEMWSKIMPLLTTSSATTAITKSSLNESSTQENSNESFSSARSNRNSKIIRINNFNSVLAAKTITNDFTRDPSTATTTTTTITFDSSTPSLTGTSDSRSTTSSDELLISSKENKTYESYWWLPVAWRLDRPTNSEKHEDEDQENDEEKEEVKAEEQNLLLRFWSAYVPKSS